MVGKQVLGWVQGGVACAISVGGGWGGCGARERARRVRGQAHRVVDVAISPPKRSRGRWWRRPRRAGDSAELALVKRAAQRAALKLEPDNPRRQELAAGRSKGGGLSGGGDPRCRLFLKDAQMDAMVQKQEVRLTRRCA